MIHIMILYEGIHWKGSKQTSCYMIVDTSNLIFLQLLSCGKGE